MIKLKRKIFYLLFSLLSLFILSFAVFFNYRTYQTSKASIESMLNSMDSKMLSQNNWPKSGEKKDDDEMERGYIYTPLPTASVFMEPYGGVYAYVSDESAFSKEEIEKLVNQITTQSNPPESYIPNLYSGKIAFNYVNENYIVLIKIKSASKQLLDRLKESIFIALIAEAILFYIVKLITRWMVRPIEETFEKQKQFIADSSHELKTPLAVIMASADAYESDPNPKWIHNIQSEAKRMSNLIGRLLQLTRTEDNRNIQFVKANLSLTIEKSILTYESMAFEQGVDLDYKVEDDIFMNCDPEQIKQVVGILIDNAIEHTPKGKKIRILLEKKKENAIFKVSNEGDPIPKGEEEKIFERFYRVDQSRNRTGQRYGLGLAIARNIVSHHNGTIRAFSKDGWTSFVVTFKL